MEGRWPAGVSEERRLTSSATVDLSWKLEAAGAGGRTSVADRSSQPVARDQVPARLQRPLLANPTEGQLARGSLQSPSPSLGKPSIKGGLGAQ